MVPTETVGELSTHLTSSAVIVYVIEALKKSPITPWINDRTSGIARLVSVVAAVAVSVGMSWHYQSDTGDLVVHGLTAAAVAGFAWECVKQFVFQKAFYDTISKPKEF